MTEGDGCGAGCGGGAEVGAVATGVAVDVGVTSDAGGTGCDWALAAVATSLWAGLPAGDEGASGGVAFTGCGTGGFALAPTGGDAPAGLAGTASGLTGAADKVAGTVAEIAEGMAGVAATGAALA